MFLQLLILSVFAAFSDGELTRPQPRIAFGQFAQANAFPWHVSIAFDDEEQRAHYCSGSILSAQWVLTAAHCVNGRLKVTMGFGSIYLQKPAVTMESSSFTIFPLYSAISSSYDLALIHLPKKLTFTKTIQPVSLPSMSHEEDTFNGQKAVLCGFGRTSLTSGLSPKLKWAEVKVISNEECTKYFGQDIHPSTLCTIGWNRVESPCPGDSGGALVVMDNGKWIQIGVMNFIKATSCTSGTPAGYIRVNYILEWISGITGIPVDD